MTSWHFDLFALCLLISSTACLGASRSAQSYTSIKREEKELKVLTLFLMLWTHPESSRGSCGHVLILSCPGLLTNEHMCVERKYCSFAWAKRLQALQILSRGCHWPCCALVVFSGSRNVLLLLKLILYNWITGSSKFSKTTNHKKKWRW